MRLSSVSCLLLLATLFWGGHLALAQTPLPAEPPPTDSAGADASVAGTWDGTLQVGGTALRLVVHIQKTGSGFSSTLDSPDQGAYDIPVAHTRVTGDSLRLDVTAVNGRYDGARHAPNRIDGTWTQGGVSASLVLTPARDASGPNRPQTPEPPFPYGTEDLAFRNEADGLTLAGTFSRPSSDGPHPTVVLVSGSGAQTRDSEVARHKLFLVVADYLTRQGIAVFRYDERGVGASEGTFATATTADLARDAQAAVEAIAARDDVRTVGLYGHSEGGWVAPMVDARSDAVDFLVLMAPPSVPGDALITEQRARIVASQGAPPAYVDSVRAQQARVTRAAARAPDSTAAARQIRRTLTAIGGAEAQITAQIRAMTTPWFRYFISNDPADALREVDVPVLALFAENDLQVIPEQNRPPLEAALNASDSPDVTVDTVPGMNHLFQPSDTGRISEYGQIETTMAPAVLERIAAWVQAHAP